MRMLRVLARIEALKALKRPAFWITIGVFVLFIAMVTFTWSGGDSPQPTFPEAWRSIIQMASNLGPIFLAALLILLFAPEFRWKTARQSVIDGLGREHLYWGKVLLLAALVALFFAVPLVVGFVALIPSLGGGSGGFVEPMDLNYMLGFFVALLLFGTMGFMVSALVRAAGGGLGILLIYAICEQIVRELLSARWRALEGILDFLPATLFQTIVDVQLHYPALLARTNLLRAERGQDPLTFPDLWILLAAAAAYVVLFLALAYASVRRRDL